MGICPFDRVAVKDVKICHSRLDAKVNVTQTEWSPMREAIQIALWKFPHCDVGSASLVGDLSKRDR